MIIFSLLFFLMSPISVPAQAESVPRLFFILKHSRIEFVKMSRDFELRRDGFGNEIPNPLNDVAELIQHRLLPEFLDFFPQQNVLGKELIVEVHDVLPDNYCAFVPNERSAIWVRRDCLSESQLAPVFFHELQHVVENLNTRKETWLNEGLSELLAYRLIHQFPVAIWQNQMNRSQTTPLLFNGNNLHAQSASTPQDFYSSANLFLTYLYQHFGGDTFLRNLILSSDSGTNAITEVIKNLNHHAFDLDEKYLTFDSIFFNFVVALNLNSHWGAQNNLFSISGPESFLNFKLQPSFDILDAPNTLTRKLEPYQSLSIRLATNATCLKWTSNAKLKVLAINTSRETQNIRDIKSNECFQLKPMEVISITSFSEATTVEIK